MQWFGLTFPIYSLRLVNDVSFVTTPGDGQTHLQRKSLYSQKHDFKHNINTNNIFIDLIIKLLVNENILNVN